MTPANLRAVTRPAPAQAELPLPAPPHRPFVALARDTRIGAGPVRKAVFLALATYCPLMAKAWIARGRVKRETLLTATEIAKMETLDGHLAGLRADGWIVWKRTGRTSEFEVRLRVGIEAVPDPPSDGGSDPPSDGGSAGESRSPISGNAIPHLREADPPSDGGSTEAAEGSGRILQQQQQQAPLALEDTGAPVQHGGVGESDPPRAPTTAQIELLEVCADRLTAAMPGDRLLGDRRAVQQQIAIAKRMRVSEGDFKHKHKTDAEILIDSGIAAGIQWRDVVQRCPCGALRSATLYRDGAQEDGEWVLCSLLATACGDGEFMSGEDVEPDDAMLSGWRPPYTWSEVKRQPTAAAWKCRGCGAETGDFPASGCEGCAGTAFDGG